MKKPRPDGSPSSQGGGARLTPEAIARRAVARRPTTPSGDRVRLTLTIALTRDLAERLTARAIRQGKDVDTLVAEILEREARRP